MLEVLDYPNNNDKLTYDSRRYQALRNDKELLGWIRSPGHHPPQLASLCQGPLRSQDCPPAHPGQALSDGGHHDVPH